MRGYKMLTLTVVKNLADSTTTYTVTVPDQALARVKLDAFDTALMNQPTGSVADELLKLERLAFRMEQQAGH